MFVFKAAIRCLWKEVLNFYCEVLDEYHILVNVHCYNKWNVMLTNSHLTVIKY